MKVSTNEQNSKLTEFFVSESTKIVCLFWSEVSKINIQIQKRTRTNPFA